MRIHVLITGHYDITNDEETWLSTVDVDVAAREKAAILASSELAALNFDAVDVFVAAAPAP